MNTFSNFGSMNGRMLPGSGWGGCGCGPDMFYVDCNGEVWVPCVCGATDPVGSAGGTGATGGTGETGPAGFAGESASIAEAAEGRLQYIPNRNGTSIQVNYPEAILHYAGQKFTLNGRQYDKGMLADTDKGHRYAYRGSHTGRVRLHIAQTNKTTAKAVMNETGGATLLDGVYPGAALHYGICFAAKEGATVTVLRQGAFVGWRGNHTALKEYLRFAQEPRTLVVEKEREKWLFLGRAGVPGTEREAVPCGFMEEYEQRVPIGTEPHRASMEALLDIEIIGEAEIICCAFQDFDRVDLNGSMFPLPMVQENPRGESAVTSHNMTFNEICPMAGLTGVRHRFWGFEGMFAWDLDDNSNAAGITLEASEEPEPFEVLASRDPWPRNEHNLDQILFYPPIASAARELRRAERAGAANRGTVYHQIFVLRNHGELPRRVNYYAESGEGSEVTLAVSPGQVVSYRAGDAPQLASAVPRIEPHGKKIVESWFVCDAQTQLKHILRSDEAANF